MRRLTVGTSHRIAKGALQVALCCLLLTAFCLLTSASEWRRQRSGTFAWLHAVHFIDRERGWAVGGKGALLRTEDGGDTWRQSQSPAADTMRDIFFADERRGWIVCERDVFTLKSDEEARSYLLRTGDGGATWSRVELADKGERARVVRVAFSDAEHGWAFGEEGTLYATSDGGATWQRQQAPTRRLLLGAHFIDARTGWVVGAGSTFLYTADGGASWRAGSVVSGAAAVVPAAAVVARPTSAERAGDGIAYATAPRVNAVSFIDGRRGWAVGSGGAVFATINGGRSWRALASGTDVDLFDVKFFDARTGWAVGSGGTVIRTHDGGETWVAQPTGTTHQLERLFFADRDNGWAVGFGGTILNHFDASVARPEQPSKRPALQRRDPRPTP
jgi:photosystem II stability/assembly factor-like uncharacterized protein